MTIKQVEEKLTDLMHREPFEPFVIEMHSGVTLSVHGPHVAFDETGGVLFDGEGALVDFVFCMVRSIRLTSDAPT